MIKRIIFDQDNTIMKWKDEYIDSYKKALDELNIKYTNSQVIRIDNLISEYEKKYKRFSKKDMVDFLNSNIDITLPNNYIDIWMKYLCDCYSKEDSEIIPLLKYLSSKYELVILSNWFEYSQVIRLKNAKLDKYFCEMFFTEKIDNKPSKESFLIACGNNKPSECLMIGDNLNIDVIGAKNAGLNAILLDKDNKYNYNNKIRNLNELKEIL